MTTFNDTHRWTYALLAACVFFFLFQATITAQPPDENAEESADSPVHIPDPALRRAFEVALDKSAGDDITQAEMATLTSFHATGAGVSDLTGLEYATQLTQLGLWGNPIADLSPLETLTQLQSLVLRNCWITDISPLQGLRQLRNVDLQNNRITDVSPLLDLPNLTWAVKLNGNAITDVSAFQQATAPITWLELTDNQIVDVSPLLSLPNLSLLHLSGNAISDVSAFQQATAPIMLLQLMDNQIVDISPLAAFIRQVGSLWELALRGNPITDFSPFLGLTLNDYDFEIPLESTEESIDIPDPIFRKDIIRALGKTMGAPLTVADLEQLETLITAGTDFTRLEHAINLKRLRIRSWGALRYRTADNKNCESFERVGVPLNSGHPIWPQPACRHLAPEKLGTIDKIGRT